MLRATRTLAAPILEVPGPQISARIARNKARPCKVATSRIAGLGLFATRRIKADEKIAEYKGTIMRGPFVLSFHGDASYVFQWKDPETQKILFIDALDDPCHAMYANDALGPKRIKGRENNAYFDDTDWKDEGIWIRALKEIRPGEEICVAYGRQYWGMTKEEYQ